MKINIQMIRQNLRISLISLSSNPLRSFLTISGVIIGITAVVTAISIGEGHEKKIEASIRQLGENVFWAELEKSFHFGQYQDSGSMNIMAVNKSGFLSLPDVKAIRSRCTAVQYSAPLIVSFASGIINGESMQVRVIATVPEYMKVTSASLLSGRYLIDDDLNRQNEICIIEANSKVKLGLFQQNYVTVASRRFKITGVIKSGSSNHFSGDIITIHIPINVAQTKISGSSAIHSIYCKAKDNLLNAAKQQVSNIIDSQNDGKLKFVIRGNRDIFKTKETLTRNAKMVSAGIGMLSLFVGGIGIMNILLSSITERIKEIGIRRSVGARKRDIWLQFLFESVAFSLAGGIIGIFSGFLATSILSKLTEVLSVLSFTAVGIGLCISTLTGIIFGIFPAWKASRLKPIESLRYE